MSEWNEKTMKNMKKMNIYNGTTPRNNKDTESGYAKQIDRDAVMDTIEKIKQNVENEKQIQQEILIKNQQDLQTNEEIKISTQIDKIN